VEGLDLPPPGKSSPFDPVGYAREALGLADSEHFRATGWAYALGCRLAVLHGNVFSILHFFLRLAFNAISLHIQASSLTFYSDIKPLAPSRSSRWALPDKNGAWGEFLSKTLSMVIYTGYLELKQRLPSPGAESGDGLVD